VVSDLKEVEDASDLIGLRQELQSFISGVKNNRDTSQCLKLYIEELKKILHKHTDIGKEKQENNMKKW
jgi:hypothetical protein